MQLYDRPYYFRHCDDGAGFFKPDLRVFPGEEKESESDFYAGGGEVGYLEYEEMLRKRSADLPHPEGKHMSPHERSYFGTDPESPRVFLGDDAVLMSSDAGVMVVVQKGGQDAGFDVRSGPSGEALGNPCSMYQVFEPVEKEVLPVIFQSLKIAVVDDRRDAFENFFGKQGSHATGVLDNPNLSGWQRAGREDRNG